MKDLRLLNAYRLWDQERAQGAPPSYGGSPVEGIFELPSPTDKGPLLIIASADTEGWDHISVSRTHRCPNWHEMEFVKRTFFKDDETAFQLHPPIAEYVDGSWPGKRSINCLHIWSCLTQPMPRPPRHMVGANSAEEARKTLSGNDLVKAGLIPKGSAA